MSNPVVVIGIGNSFRRDDGVGPAVAEEVARQGLSGIRVVSCAAETTAILDAWHGAERAVLVDAAAGEQPGRVRTGTLDDIVETSPVSSHDLNLRQTYELGCALGRAPDSVAVVSVEVADTGHGVGLTAPVRASLPHAVRVVLDLLGREESVDQQP